MMFEARRPSTRWHRRAAAFVPAFSSTAAAARARRASGNATWRMLSATVAVWLLFPIAAHGQARTPHWTVLDGGGANSHLTNAAVITSVGLNPGTDTVEFSTSDHLGFDVFSAPLSGFPTEGSSFFVISSGFTAAVVPSPTHPAECCTSGLLDGLDNGDGEDLVSITFVATPPETAQCLSFDFKFFSEEFPDFVGSEFNDTFLAETPTSTFTVVEGEVTAPNNVAFDSAENPITINTVFGMSVANASDTTYNGATPALTTDVPISLGSESITMVFSVMDVGDSAFDTTVFIDNLRWGDADCDPITDLTPQEADLVQVYHSSQPSGVPECAPGGPTCNDPITGAVDDAIHLWIDGGSEAGPPEKTVCKFGPSGSIGDNLCGADILIQMESGSFTGIEPIIDTLVCNPSCAADCEKVGEETDICSLPEGTTSIRMNFRRGATYSPPNPPPPLGPREVATLVFDSSSGTPGMPTQIFANGVAAAGANLQVRRIANAVDLCENSGHPFTCCTGRNSGNGQWPCGARVIAPVPEPGQIWQLLSGLAGLGFLYRLRRHV